MKSEVRHLVDRVADPAAREALTHIVHAIESGRRKISISETDEALTSQPTGGSGGPAGGSGPP